MTIQVAFNNSNYYPYNDYESILSTPSAKACFPGIRAWQKGIAIFNHEQEIFYVQSGSTTSLGEKAQTANP